MATASNDMKGFYKQRKNNKTGIKKSSSKSKNISPTHAAAIGSGITQPSALSSHGAPDLQDVYDQREQVLRQFDMNMAYGPCLGMTRVARLWLPILNVHMCFSTCDFLILMGE